MVRLSSALRVGALILPSLIGGVCAHGAVLTASGAAVRRQDSGISEFINNLHVCILQPGQPGSPANVSLGIFGTLQLWKLCCKNTSIGGLDVKTTITNPGLDWAGDTNFDIKLDYFASQCHGHWTYKSSAVGNFSMKVGTAPDNDADPFAHIGLDLAGEPIHAGGDPYPWPGKVSDVSCKLNFDIESLLFEGSGSSILNALGGISKYVQGTLHLMFCAAVKDNLRQTLKVILPQARNFTASLISNIPGGLDPPSVPAGAGPTYDLRTSKPAKWVHSLLQQGLETGDLGRLVERVSNGKDSATMKLGETGLSVANISVPHPVNISVNVFAETAGLEGMHTIDQADLSVQDKGQLGLLLSQAHLNVSLGLRTLVRATEGSSDAGMDNVALEMFGQAIDSLLEKFSLRLALSDLHVAGQTGLLIDQNRLDYLDVGSSWYDPQCMPSMMQNASIMSMDVQVVVDEFTFVSAAETPTQLEADVARSVNNVLGYLNTPMMRPTVTRLVRAIAAGQARDMINNQLQALLVGTPNSTCTSEVGFGSWVAYDISGILGACACLAAVIVLVAWVWRRGTVGSNHPALRVAAFLAAAGLCFQMGGLLGWPFRAGIRTHDGSAVGEPGEDTIVYMYVLEVSDVIFKMPGVAAATTFGVLLSSTRMLAVVNIALCGLNAYLARFVRWSIALGGWGMIMPYMFAFTQIPSFYARIVQFGQVWIDMGVQINAAFYVVILGLYLCDGASLMVYSRCSAATAKAPQVAKRPPRFALLGLAAALAALLAAPWFTLWTHSYSGVVGTVIHYQNGGYTRPISIAMVLSHSQDWLLNPSELGIGIYIMQFIMVVHAVLAPVLHAVLALYVGITLRWQGPIEAVAAVQPARGGQISDAGSSASFLSTSAEAKVPFRRTGYLLVLARMWSGADAMAAAMVLIVPDLTAQLNFMSAQACDPMDPMLTQLHKGCNVLTSEFNGGLLVLFLAGLAVRIFAELCAHGPLRGSMHKPAREVSVSCPNVVP